MFLSKVLGKKNKSEDENLDKDLVKKVSKMNLNDMRFYINGKMTDFDISEDGIEEVLKRLILTNKETSKRFIEIDDMDSKIKKAFELILSILDNKKITVVGVELVQKFIEMYQDIILDYDTRNKQIYSSKFREKIISCLDSINAKTDLINKMTVVGS